MINGNGWESNPPRLATRPDTGVEDREAHQDLTIPIHKDNFAGHCCQHVSLINPIFTSFAITANNGCDTTPSPKNLQW